MAARRSCCRREYRPQPRASGCSDWFQDLFAKAQGGAGSFGGLSGAVLLGLTRGRRAAARVRALAAAAQPRRRPHRPGRCSATSGARPPSTAGWRGRRYDTADWDDAVVEGMRALAAGLVERRLVDDVPAATAHEVTTLAAPRFPSYADRLERAARVFDETRYGDHRADPRARRRDARPRCRAHGRQPGQRNRCAAVRWRRSPDERGRPPRSSGATALRVAPRPGAGRRDLLGLAVVNRDNARFGGDLDPAQPRRRRAPRRSPGCSTTTGSTSASCAASGPSATHRSTTDTTVVVTNPDQLGRSTFARLRSHARSAGAVVAGRPETPVLEDAFGLEPRSLGDRRPVRQLRRAARRRADHPGTVRRRGRPARAASATAARWPCTGRPPTGGSGCSWPPTCSATTTSPRRTTPRCRCGCSASTTTLVWYVADSDRRRPRETASRSRSLLPRWLVPGTVAAAPRHARAPALARPSARAAGARAAAGRGARRRVDARAAAGSTDRARDRGHAADDPAARDAAPARRARWRSAPTAPTAEIVHAVAARTGRVPTRSTTCSHPPPSRTTPRWPTSAAGSCKLEDEVRPR